MIRRNKILVCVLVLACLVVASLIAWAPWITVEYACSKVMKLLSGPDALFTYLGEIMPFRGVPKTFKKAPFVSLVYFPGEAMLMVAFLGNIL